jgi:dTDP-glucose pyrophosphorylase
MNIVITMAGLGSRFKKAGYCMPKYMIDVKGKTLFEWSVNSLSGFVSDKNTYIFIVRKEDDSREFIQNKCVKLNLLNYKIIEIDSLTDGQATTVTLANKVWEPKSDLLIYNIDTYIEEHQMNLRQIKGDGFIPCFIGQGNHWSFVKINTKNEAVSVKEKERISDYCTVGAYYFKSCELYMDLYREYYKVGSNMGMGEKYIAPLYNQLIAQKGKVYISIIPIEKVHVLGTPEEVEEFKKNSIFDE